MRLVNILPADMYEVVNRSLLNDSDISVLSTLYQPIMGSSSLSLYLTLWSDLERKNVSNFYSHHHLICMTSLKLDELVNARKKLEALGLIKTYYKFDNGENIYIYELYSPLSASEFFSNPILSTSLLSSLGKKDYQNMINYYKIQKINTNEYDNISVHFSDIYGMVDGTIVEDGIKSKDKLDVIIDEVLDFNYIESSMPKGIVSTRAFSNQIRKLSNRLAYLYNLDNTVMIELLKDSVNEKGLFNESELKKNCKNYYSFEHKNNPKLVYKSKKDVTIERTGVNIKDKLIESFEKTSPYDFLRAKYGGAKPTSKDLNLIESLLVDQELNPGVVNVLVDYVLRTNDKKLNKSLIEAIASQWKMSNINTAKEAMQQALKEYKKNNNKDKKDITKESPKLPEWYGKNIKKAEISESDMNELKNLISDFM